MIYTTVFSGVATMLIYIAAGFGLTKFHKTLTEHAKTLSGLLIYCCSPCMIVNSFLNLDYSLLNFRKFMLFFAAALIIHALAFALIYLVLHKKFEDARYRILNIGAVLGNAGFFGQPIIKSVFPDEPIVACYSIVYITAMNILVFTMATYLMTSDKKYASVKTALINPTCIPAAIGVLLYLAQVQLPGLISSAISTLSAMSTPLCMIILGLRLANMSFKQIFSQGFAYVVSLLKLVIYPLFAYLCICWIPFLDDTFKVSMLILSACPTAAVVLTVAEFHDSCQELSANVILMSTLLCIVTLPILCMLFV